MDSGVQSSRSGAAFEVLSPWAEADPVPLRGITPRVKSLEGRKIGLFSNGKRAAALMLSALERELKEKAVEVSRYTCSRINTPEILTEGKAKFEAWVAGLDAVVLSVGD